jgi:hypothetical protein
VFVLINNLPVKNVLISAIFFLLFLFTGTGSMGQSKRPEKPAFRTGRHNHPSGKMNSASIAVNFPLGGFSSTHIVGTSAEYAWSNYRFGKMDIKPVKPFGFLANTGLAYYFGKKETAIGYPYDYPGYLFLHIYGGVIYNPWKKGNVNLTLGPALGLYNGNTQFNMGGKIEGSYYIKEKIGISPAFLIMKEHGADALWVISFKAAYCF